MAVPNIGKLVIDAHESLNYKLQEQAPYTTEQIMGKITELRDNYHVVGDPKSTEAEPKQFGVSILNKDLLDQGVPAILMVTTDGSSLYDEELNPNNEGNAIDLAYMALAHPDQPVIVVENPGSGNSTNMTKDEYKQAAKDGRLMEATINDDGRLVDFKTFKTIDSIVRALASEGLDNISHISTNSTSILYATAAAAALKSNSLEKAFLYNPTNISDWFTPALIVGRLREIAGQSKYQSQSHDPLRHTDELKEMAKKAMSDKPKRKIDQARASTHNPINLLNKQRIFARGNKRGQAAAVHVAAATLQHPKVRQTIVVPEFAAQYKRPEDFRNFINRVFRLLGSTVEIDEDEIKTLQIPLGEYGHSHYPTVHQTLEDYAFNR